MKKFISSLAVLLALTSVAATFYACNDADDTQFSTKELCYFTIGLGVDTLKFEGDQTSKEEVYAYMENVEQALFSAIGTTDGLLFNGDYAKHAAELKVLFSNAALPDRIETSGKYSFTYHLYGTDKVVDGMKLEDMQVLISKSFFNHIFPEKPADPDTPIQQ